jgi:hypothetical protein
MLSQLECQLLCPECPRIPARAADQLRQGAAVAAKAAEDRRQVDIYLIKISTRAVIPDEEDFDVDEDHDEDFDEEEDVE